MTELTFLGTGTSHGIPVPGCNCEVCNSSDIRNRRSRPSVLFRVNDIQILIDTAPEFRLQALDAKLRHLDGVLFTHDHSDHLHGIDDLRPFSRNNLPVYGSNHVLGQIRKRFPYIFREPIEGGGTPRLKLHPVTSVFNIKGVSILPVPLNHGRASIFGYRMGPVAYCTDCSSIPRESMEMLGDLDILVLDALRFKRHSTHFSVEEALEVIEELKPGCSYLTHLCHDVDHAKLEAALPDNVRLAHDGLRVSCSYSGIADASRKEAVQS